ncbi:cytochrome P450 [Xylariales sp. PMI_506]|nr:cytochrome P450 [Xylariales sp. PMI_506]
MFIPEQTFLPLLGVIVIPLCIWSISSTIRQYYRLRHIKGPAIAGFSKWWLIRHVMGGRTHLDLYEVCQKYGDIARVGPSDIITSDPDLVRHMLSVRSGYSRSSWYFAMRFDPSRDNLLSMLDGRKHNMLRSKLTHGYSGKEVENLEAAIDQNVLGLVDLVQTYASQNKPFDFGRKAQFFTMDVISNVAFGDAFGFLAADDDLFDYCKTFQEQMPNIIFTTVYPWLLNVLQLPIIKRVVPSNRDPLGFGKLMGIAKDVVEKRYNPTAKHQRDMLGSFMAHGLTKEEAESETLLQILAGSDTTATAVRATMLYIITNPRVYNALRAEIAESTTPVVTDAEARSMPYLQAVIKEGLRLYPPIVGLQSKVVPYRAKGGDGTGDTWKGVRLPGGTNIGLCYWGMMRRPDVWGHDASEFRPERWLEVAASSDPERLARMDAAWEMIFAQGRWQCLGKNVALMELNKVFVELLRRFDFTLIDPTNPWISINVGAFIQREFWIRAYKRE